MGEPLRELSRASSDCYIHSENQLRVICSYMKQLRSGWRPTAVHPNKCHDSRSEGFREAKNERSRVQEKEEERQQDL